MLFELPQGRVGSPEAATELRAADFALLVRERHGNRVRCAVASGDCARGTLGMSGLELCGVAGAPVPVATDLIRYAEAGQIAINGVFANAVSTEYALKPIGGTYRDGKHIPAGTALLLWREFPLPKDGVFVGRERELNEIQRYLAARRRRFCT